MERRTLAERNACRTACDRDAEPGGNRSRTRQDTCSEYSGTFDSTQEPDALAAHVRICAGGLIQRVEIPLWISSLRRPLFLTFQSPKAMLGPIPHTRGTLP